MRRRKACQKTGLTGKIPHDLGRTVVRNVMSAGIPESVIMQVARHKTRTIFNRYHIVSEGDMQEASKRLDTAFLARTMTKTMTVPPISEFEKPLTH